MLLMYTLSPGQTPFQQVTSLFTQDPRRDTEGIYIYELLLPTVKQVYFCDYVYGLFPMANTTSPTVEDCTQVDTRLNFRSYHDPEISDRLPHDPNISERACSNLLPRDPNISERALPSHQVPFVRVCTTSLNRDASIRSILFPLSDVVQQSLKYLRATYSDGMTLGTSFIEALFSSTVLSTLWTLVVLWFFGVTIRFLIVPATQNSPSHLKFHLVE